MTVAINLEKDELRLCGCLSVHSRFAIVVLF